MSNLFRITSNHGFHITFENGVTVSVQFGYGNYCANRNNLNLLDHPYELVESENAEVAIWDAQSDWVRYPGEYDDVISNVSPAKLIEILNFAQSMLSSPIGSLSRGDRASLRR